MCNRRAGTWYVVGATMYRTGMPVVEKSVGV